MNAVQSSEDVDFDSEVPVLIVGAGAAGLCAPRWPRARPGSSRW